MYAKIKRYHKRHGFNKTTEMMLDKLLLKRYHNQKKAKKVTSLLENTRCRYEEDDSDSYIEYGFVQMDDGMSDEEIERGMRDGLEMTINSPYDCTGKPFTQFIKWHKNPGNLISFIHGIGLDV